MSVTFYPEIAKIKDDNGNYIPLPGFYESGSSVRDEKAAFNLLNSAVLGMGENKYTWELGAIDSSTGAETAVNTRIRSPYFLVTRKSTLSISDSSAQLYVFKYNADGSYAGKGTSNWATSWTNGSTDVIVRVVIRKSSSNPTISVMEIPTVAAYLQFAYTTYNALTLAPYFSTQISTSDDLNDFKTPGTFNVPTTTIASAASHMPRAKIGRLIVFNPADLPSNKKIVWQWYVESESDAWLWARVYNEYDSAWTPWHRLMYTDDEVSDHYDAFGAMMQVAESYLHAAYDADSRLIYSSQHGLFTNIYQTKAENVQDNGVNAIVCSQFVEACMYGIYFNQSRYVKDANARTLWGLLPDGDFQYYASDCIDDYMTAANLARYCDERGWLHEFDTASLATRPSPLKPGDILFYTSSGYSTYNEITHCAFCVVPYKTTYLTAESTTDDTRLIDNLGAGVRMIKREYAPSSGRQISYYARMPFLTPAHYTTKLVDKIDGPYSGNYNDTHKTIVTRNYEHPLPAGIYTIECEDDGDSPVFYVIAFHDNNGTTIQSPNYECQKIGNRNYIVFYAQLPISALTFRTYARISSSEPLGRTYNVKNIKVYQGYRPLEA